MLFNLVFNWNLCCSKTWRAFALLCPDVITDMSELLVTPGLTNACLMSHNDYPLIKATKKTHKYEQNNNI